MTTNSKIIIGIVVVLAAGAGVFALTKSKSAVAPEAPVSNKSADTQQTEWKIYSNKDFGYEISYPANWYLKEDSTIHGPAISQDNNLTAVSVGTFHDLQSEVGASNAKYFTHTDLSVYMNDPQFQNVQKITFLGLTAYSAQFTNKITNLSWTEIWFNRSGLVYELTSDNQSHFLGIEKQIIDSFKFTGEPAQTTPTDWKTYTNPSAGYQIQYPPYLTAGKVAANSVLGTFDVPVPGVFVGSLVFITVTSANSKTANDYFNGFYQSAQNPPPASPEGPSAACAIPKIVNPNATIKAVSCNGEGGAAFYALITLGAKSVFVDGYSKGFVNSGYTEFKSESDLETALSTFKFNQ